MRLAIILVFLTSILQICSAQNETPVHLYSLEMDLAIFDIVFYDDDPNIVSTNSVDTISHGVYSAHIPEIRLRYFRQLSKHFSAYTGLYFSVPALRQYLIFADTIYNYTFPRSSQPYPEHEYNYFKVFNLPYVSIPLGARVTTLIFRNDRINFSLAAKANFYPRRKTYPSNSFYSELREEMITITHTSNLNSSSKITAGLEADLNYQWVSKKERFNLSIGVIIDQNYSNFLALNSVVSSETLSFSYDYFIRSQIIGGYIGCTFMLGK